MGVELVLRAVLGLLNDQFPRLDIDFELQFLRNPQRFCLHLWKEGRGGKGKKRRWSSLLGAFSARPRAPRPCDRAALGHVSLPCGTSGFYV